MNASYTQLNQRQLRYKSKLRINMIITIKIKTNTEYIKPIWQCNISINREYSELLIKCKLHTIGSARAEIKGKSSGK